MVGVSVSSTQSKTVTTPSISYGPDPEQGYTFFPNGKTGPQPTVVFIHGGFWNSASFKGAEARAKEINAAGYSMASLGYQLVAKNGTGLWPKQRLDVIAGMNAIRARSDVNPARVCVLGESAGGHLAMWAGIDGKAKCVINRWGPIDLVGSKVPAVLAMAGLTSLHNVSPLYYITGSYVPTLFVSGSKDDLVPVKKNVVPAQAKMASFGIQSYLHTFKGGHQFDGTSISEKNAVFKNEMTFLKYWL